jgi:hypothetical protein
MKNLEENLARLETAAKMEGFRTEVLDVEDNFALVRLTHGPSVELVVLTHDKLFAQLTLAEDELGMFIERFVAALMEHEP